MSTCWIIAGPNGAGKTTFAMEYLPNVAGCTYFINADRLPLVCRHCRLNVNWLPPAGFFARDRRTN